jgi:aryl-phospho-beta-D-glucosidase BglC (GH1 family)
MLGRCGVDCYYEDAAGYRAIARTGAAIVRLSVTWERLQHRLGGPLDAREVDRVRTSLRAAGSAGLGVVLDLHGYGDYWVADGTGHRRLLLGSQELSTASFADLWRRLATAMRDSPAVLGYGLMNEPTKLAADPMVGARRWEHASQVAVDAIRSTGDQRTVFVSGYGGASPSQWPRYHPRAWVHDPAGQVRYEAHQYFDADHTGEYGRTFTEEVRRARVAGFEGACSTTTSERR